MTEIQQNRWDQLVRRVANVVGGGSQVGDTLNELFPVLDVESVPIELLALSRYQVAMGTSSFGALAANNNAHQLFNPAGSTSLLVLTTCIFHAGTSQNMRMAVSTTPLTTDVGNVVRRDTREGVTARVIGQNRAVQQAAGIAAHMIIRVEANVSYTLRDQNGLFVLFPGTGITLSTSVQNGATACGWWWRERVFEPAEINF